MIEEIILGALLSNENYSRKVIPFLKNEYFHNNVYCSLFDQINKFILKYNTLPTKDILKLENEAVANLSQTDYESSIKLIDNLSFDSNTDINWLVDTTEKFCQDKAIYNAVKESILILDNSHKTFTKEIIPDLLSKALQVSFDSNVGHDFIDDSDERFDFYNSKEEKVEFDLGLLNKITKGGVSRKSLTIFLAATGVGKTLVMCHCAASNLMNNKNVLYITNEMSEERIGERIDANLMDIMLDDLKILPKESYQKKINRLRERTIGKLIIKEYPTATASVSHFRHLLQELKIKKKFIPDIIYVDYLNICISSRLKQGNNVNTYSYIKAIAEELRGLAVEYNVPVISATQSNRDGYNNSDIDLTNTSESIGLPATCDFMVALISTEELEGLNQLLVKQLKNRWGSLDQPKRFVIGINRSKMKLYDLEDQAQENIVD